MAMNDPMSDFLTRVRNAIQARKESVDVPASKIFGKILEIFKTDGYIADFRLMKTNTQGTYKIYLKYEGRKSAVMGLEVVSKPGLRIYAPAGELPKVLNGLGTAVVSTSKGVMTDRQARQANVGGEVLCQIW
ncbi:MAG: 30S ribosomal protein S8 [Candidatus Omnitrophica bacterium]|nr:30S ribosomal protein S8 [Candidatus Omnitrophota bacterium]